jgi:hypothetical protein
MKYVFLKIVFSAVILFFCLNSLSAQTVTATPINPGILVPTPTETFQEQQADLINGELEKVHNPKAEKMIRRWMKKWSYLMECKEVSIWEISPGIISVGIFGYENTLGGAMASFEAYKDYTFDAATGTVFELSDLFQTHTDWENVLWHYVYIGVKSCSGIPEAAIRELKSKDYKSFYLDGQNLILDFDQCTLLPCICEGVRVKIPLKDIQSILKPAFIPSGN